MRMNKTLVCLYLILALLLQPAAYGGNGDNGPSPTASTEKVSEDHAADTTLAMTGGCVGGALLGTVVPFFGNVAGCVLGGVAAWWFARDKQAIAADRQREPAPNGSVISVRGG